MPRYFINFRMGDLESNDQIGIDVLDLEAAKSEAIASARKLLAEDVRWFTDKPLTLVIIMDEKGQEIWTIPASLVLSEP